MPLIDIAACKTELERLGQRRLYWFKPGTYASFADALHYDARRELSEEVRNYLHSNILVRFFWWLFTDINRRVELLAYYTCRQAVEAYESNDRAQANGFLGFFGEAWILRALGRGSVLKEVANALLELVSNLQTNVKSNPLPSVTFTGAWRFNARLKPQPTHTKNDYEYLGSEVTADTDIAGLKKAFKKRALIKHPDKGGSAEEFNKLQAAYVLAVYKRTLPPYNEDAQGLLAKEDLRKLEERLQAENLGVESLSVDNMFVFFAASMDLMQAEIVELRKDWQALGDRWDAIGDHWDAIGERWDDVSRSTAQLHRTLDRNEATMSELKEMWGEFEEVIAQAKKDKDFEKLQKIQTASAGLLQMLLEWEERDSKEASLTSDSNDNDASISSPKMR